VRYLILQGANVDVRNNAGQSPLDVTSTDEKRAILRAAMERTTPAPPSPPPLPAGYRPPVGITNIFIAAQRGTVNDVRYFLARGEDVNQRDGSGDPLSHHAVRENNVEVAVFLIVSGADVNATDTNDWTPLHIAVHNPGMDMMRHLISHGANVNARNNVHWTPLHYAARYNPNAEVLRYLIFHGADVNARINIGLTALDLADGALGSVAGGTQNGKRAVLWAAGGRSGR